MWTCIVSIVRIVLCVQRERERERETYRLIYPQSQERVGNYAVSSCAKSYTSRNQSIRGIVGDADAFQKICGRAVVEEDGQRKGCRTGEVGEGEVRIAARREALLHNLQ